VAGREKNYPPKIKVGDAELETVNIYRNTFHGEWNYEIRPHSRTSALTAIIVARVVTKQLHRVGELRRKAVLRAGRVVRRRYAASAGLSAENCCQRLSSASPLSVSLLWIVAGSSSKWGRAPLIYSQDRYSTAQNASAGIFPSLRASPPQPDLSVDRLRLLSARLGPLSRF